jgi:light-regulated signal transduction histidine kinase (bacteriophytochrome)
MSQIIDALLNLSRISRGNLTLSEVNLAEIARSIMKEIMEQEPSRKVNFLCPPRLTAWADARLIQIALTNLLHNAWKFTSLKEEAVIEVGERKEGREKVFFVRDNGAGFDMRYVNKLFSPFQRLHKAVEFPGIGIGLATVQRIIARHGGWIRAESTLNEGATFYFTLTKGG